MTTLNHYLVALAFQDLTRREALGAAGPIPHNAVDKCGVAFTWLTGVARRGELRCVPKSLYWKRHHVRNTEFPVVKLVPHGRRESWTHHCGDMLNRALRLRATVPELCLLRFAALERLASVSIARTMADLSGLSSEDDQTMLGSLLALAEASDAHDIPLLLDTDRPSLRYSSEAVYCMARDVPAEIISFGPKSVNIGRPFDVQPGSSAAVWLRASRGRQRNTSIRLGGREPKPVTMGTLATSVAPACFFGTGEHADARGGKRSTTAGCR